MIVRSIEQWQALFKQHDESGLKASEYRRLTKLACCSMSRSEEKNDGIIYHREIKKYRHKIIFQINCRISLYQIN